MERTHFEDQSSLHKYRTELPNILFDLNLNPYEFKLYCYFKRVAGDGGACFKCNKTISKETGISERKIRDLKKTMAEARPELDGRALIHVEKRLKDKGDKDSDWVTILDIWDLNMLKYATQVRHSMPGGPAQHAEGVRHEVPKGPARGADKEEPIKKNPQEELFVANDPVGSSPSQISVLCRDNQRISIDQTELYQRIVGSGVKWSADEIAYAWKVLHEYEGIVHDWWQFLKGTVVKYQNSKRSKKAAGEKRTYGKEKSQTRGKGICKSNITKDHSNSKKCSSTEDSSGQASLKLVCLGDLLKA